VSPRALFAAPPLPQPARRLVWAIIAAGTAFSLVLAFTTRGVGFDIESYELVRDALAAHPLHVYSQVNTPDLPHWPYPSGFFPWIVVSRYAAELTGLRFDGFIQVAPIAANAGLAWVAQAFLGQRGAGGRTRVLAAALIACGPSFVLVSGYHGQLDALSTLGAVLGFWVWTRADAPQRALVAGLLIGAGGSVKIPALLLVLALLPSARSVREGLTLIVATGAVPLLLLLPWLVGDPHGTVAALRSNNGLPGFGGISLLVQPGLAALWLRTAPNVALTSASQTLLHLSATLSIAALLASGALLLSKRTPPLLAAVVLWVTVYAFGVNFGLSYLLWGLPFFVLAGRLWLAAIVQAGALVPSLLLFGVGSREDPLQRIYVPIMLAMLAGFVILYGVEARRVLTLGSRAR
jgi:hypothetical protein